MTIHSESEDHAAESAKMKAKPSTVRIDGNCVHVDVGSLNQAYTISSLRLEPERQSHGGRIYDAMFWIDAEGNEVSFGQIRDNVECGKWNFPDISLTKEKSRGVL